MTPPHSHSPRAYTRTRRPVRLAVAAAVAGAVIWMGGCARPVDRPELSFPPDDPQDVRGREGTDSDVRTIDRTAQPPDGPITPGGATTGPRSGVNGFLAPGLQGLSASLPPILAAVEAEQETPASTPSAAEGYRTVGGIVAEVNGRPIYTDEVIAAVRNELRGLAKRVDKEQFLQQAEAIVAGEVRRRMSDELHRLVAERNLSQSDQRRAAIAATQWRVTQITAAGGSEAMARKRALDETGMTLERLVAEQEQIFLMQVFLQSVVVPRAVPSAEEVRSYYLRHRQNFSTEGRGEIDFLVIELTGGSPDATGSNVSREQALVRAQHVRELAAAGADFEELAREYNDNRSYRESGGRIPAAPLGKGEFRWPAVDAAVWQTAEGEVTPVIADDNGRRLFVAKVLSKTTPRDLGFEDVQRRITEEITDRRRRELLEQYLSDARKYAAVTPPADIVRNLRTAIEVLDQQYEVWRAE